MKRFVIPLLAMLPLTASALGPGKVCSRLGNDSEDTCAVSLSTLIARGEEFDGKIVAVTGFYAYSDRPMLFVSRDAFLVSDVADAVGIQVPKPGPLAQALSSADHQYARILGRYHATALDVSAQGGLLTGGYISELTAAGTKGDEPWGYSLPMPYGVRKK